MDFVKVAGLAGLPPDSVPQVFAAGQPFAICSTGGSIGALSGHYDPFQRVPTGHVLLLVP